MGKRSLPSKRVLLLVEDHDIVRNVLRAILEEAGYEVLAAARPTEGLALCANRGSSLDLVVADFVLPDMDGLDPEGLPPRLHVAGHRRRIGSSSCAK